MSTTKKLKVNQNFDRLLKCRANGYYDYTNIVTPTKENSDINVEMQKYDGLSYTINTQGGNSATILDFSDTLLPWKYELNSYLARTKYCLNPYRETPYEVEIFETKYNYVENVGDLTDNGGVFSGFSTSKYLKLKEKFNPNAPWSFTIKFKFKSLNDSVKVLLGHNSSGLFKLAIYERKLEFGVSTSTADWSIGQVAGTQVLQANKDYWVKAEFTGSVYNIYLSENGSNYDLEGTIASSEAFTMPNELIIGNGGWQFDEVFTGSIDLNETSITGYTIIAETDNPEAILVEQAFTQPTLSENGTMGGSSFAVTADNETNGRNPAYYAFDGNDNTYWRGSNVPGYIDFYNPTPINVKSLIWGFFYSYPTSGNVQGSNDYSDWTTITEFTNDSAADFTIDMSGNTNSYKYYRINVSSVNMDVLHCKNLSIVGTVKGYAVDVTYGLADCIYVKKSVINYNIVGSPTIENNIVSGFSRSNYITLKEPFKPEGAWEIVLKFKMNESVGREQGLFGYNGTGLFKICVGGNNRVILSLATVDYDWNIGEITGTTDIELNKYYWVKAEFTGSVYKLSLSIDGIEYNLEGTLETSSIPVFPDTTYLGVANHTYNSLEGSIDLSECYVEIDGEIKPLVGSVTEQLYGIIDEVNFTTSLPVYCYANRDERVVLRNTKTEKLDTSDWYLGEVEIS
jgi:hypothetical protein